MMRPHESFSELCLKAEIKVIEMPEGLRRRQTSDEMFWLNYGTASVEVVGRTFDPLSVTRDSTSTNYQSILAFEKKLLHPVFMKLFHQT